MTLRLRRHFTTRTALYALSLAFFGAPALALIGPGYASLPACSASIKDRLGKPGTLEAMRTQGFSQEQRAEKKQNDSQWKIQTPFPTREPKSQEPKSQEPKSQEQKGQ